jgi:hypothetical protein
MSCPSSPFFFIPAHLQSSLEQTRHVHVYMYIPVNHARGEELDYAGLGIVGDCFIYSLSGKISSQMTDQLCAKYTMHAKSTAPSQASSLMPHARPSSPPYV